MRNASCLSDTNMSTTALYRMLHRGQTAVMDSPARFKVVACGRRWGKTMLGKTVILDQALWKDKRAWWLAPTYLIASQVWRELKAAVLPIPHIKISESERRIDLPGGGMIAVRSGHQPDNLRGEGLDLAILDEAAFMEARIWQEIVRPMLATTRGRAIFFSTPLGRNWFWELFCIGLRGDEDGWAAFHFTSADNPLIPLDELESIRRQTARHIWKREYLAQFSEEGGSVFRGIRQAVRLSSSPRPQPEHHYVAGVDWGRSHDYTVIAVIDASACQLVALDRFNKVGWSLQRGRLRAMAETWQPQVIWAEANSFGSPNIEALQDDGLPMRSFTTTASSKAPLIESLALAIERGQLGLLDDPALLSELSVYGMEALPAGGFRYGAPAGHHDDMVMATALAWHGVENSGAAIDFA